MSDDVKKYLQDVLNCILFIEEQIGKEKVFSNYQKNPLLKAAVERKIEVIGEALNKATKISELPITNAQKIIGTRNRIIHAYDAVDDIMIWEIIVNHLPLLKKEVQDLLNG